MKTRIALLLTLLAASASAQQTLMRTQKPPLHGTHWMAVTGKPLGATAGAMIFQKGGNAVDAAAAMIAADCTMWDTLSWGGETQALIYNPHTKKVIGINALGVAPTGATPEFYKGKGHDAIRPTYGPLAAVTPGTPGGIMTMLAEYGKLSLKDVLAPAIQMADGYAIEAQSANTIERQQGKLKNGRTRTKVLLRATPTTPNMPGPYAGEIFRQPDLAATLRKLVDTEQQALKQGKSRKDAIYAAYDRFYKGDIAQGDRPRHAGAGRPLHRGRSRELEGAHRGAGEDDATKASTSTSSTSGRRARRCCRRSTSSRTSTSSRWATTARATSTRIYQAMNLAFADRDFYYGDTYVDPPESRSSACCRRTTRRSARS